MSDTDTTTLPPTPDAVSRELQARRWDLRFSPSVEARFEADTGPDRRRELLVAAGVSLLVFDLFLLNDLMMRPEVLGASMFWRGAVMTPAGLLVLALLWRGVSPRVREWMLAGTVVLAMFCAVKILQATTSAAAAFDPFAFALVFMAGNVVFPLRFVPALASTVASLAVGIPGVLGHPGVPSQAATFAIAMWLGVAVFSMLACWRIERTSRQSYLLLLREALRSHAALRTADEMTALSQTDALTRLPNRRAFDAALLERWHAAARQPAPLGLLMIDIDQFKHFNDFHGHVAGDDCLRRVAEAMRVQLRETDFIGRYGGEEFVVLLPAATPVWVEATAERLRAAVERLALPHGGLPGQALVTISVGAALAHPKGPDDPVDLIDAADMALFQAKREGRNRWVAAGRAGVTAADRRGARG